MSNNNTVGVVSILQRDGSTIYMTPKRARELAIVLVKYADIAEREEQENPVEQEVKAGDA